MNPDDNLCLPAGVRNTVHRALQQIAGDCDGAESLDGQGFNKYDAEEGHWLAEEAALDDQQLVSAAKLVVKYQRQVGEDELKAAKRVLAVMR